MEMKSQAGSQSDDVQEDRLVKRKPFPISATSYSNTSYFNFTPSPTNTEAHLVLDGKNTSV